MTDTFVQHCITVYNALDEVATTKVTISGEEARIFTGKITEIFKATKIARTYYSPILKSLERHGALLKLQRGGRNQDTVYALQGLPSEWDVDGWNDSTGLTKVSTYAMLTAEVESLKSQLGGFNVVEALAEVEKRLVALEEKANKVREVKIRP